MSYFYDRYDKIKLPVQDKRKPGLRNSQLDAIHNFVHKMNFKKSSRFAPIEPLNPDEYVKD